jgi:DnaJ-class molecular chaperone
MVPVRISGGRTVQPGHVEPIAGEGMPVAGGGRRERGHLFVEFAVHLPVDVPRDLHVALQKLPTIDHGGALKDEL